jgi:hypothetical protein
MAIAIVKVSAMPTDQIGNPEVAHRDTNRAQISSDFDFVNCSGEREH